MLKQVRLEMQMGEFGEENLVSSFDEFIHNSLLEH